MTPRQSGSSAPAFSLPASRGSDEAITMSLGDYRGRPLVIAFYPADWSPVCGDQMALYNQILPQFQRYGAELVGVSVDGPYCHQAFAENRRLRFPLLSDFEPKGQMARDYGVYRAADGTSERALFVIDADGVIRWSYVSPVDINPGADEILRVLSALAQPEIATRTHEFVSEAPAAVVTLVEYGDYECPHCRRAHPIVQNLRKRFGDQLHFEFRNFPLSQIHSHAEHAAEAAVSVRTHAGMPAFERMHDAIFAHQRDGAHSLDDASLARYAAESGASSEQTAADLRSGAFTASVRAEFMEGVRSGVNGTPTFFIDGNRFDGDWRNTELLAEAITSALHTTTTRV